MIHPEVLERSKLNPEPAKRWRCRWRLGNIRAKCYTCPNHWFEGNQVVIACTVYPSRDIAESEAQRFLDLFSAKYGPHVRNEFEFIEAFPEEAPQ